MKKILITGSTGFVGSNLTRMFLTKGYEVHTLIRNTSNFWRLKDIRKEINEHEVDLNDFVRLKETVHEINPNFIVHLAVFGGRPNQTDLREVIYSNFIGTVNLINACEDIDYTCFVNTGSSSEYGHKDHPMQENEICQPSNLYGITKLSSTLYCNLIANTKKKNVGTVRLFSPFGKYEDRGRLFPDIILNAIANKDIQLGNPNAVRDFIYIDEVIDLYIQIIENPVKLKGEIFNCGYGVQHSVGYIAKKIISISESNSRLLFGSLNGRESDTETWVSDRSKVLNTFGWEPSKSFDDSLIDCYKWYVKNADLYGAIS